MRRALSLARRGWGRTWPNPMVGAVLVKAGRVVGWGWHRRPGGPHAEIHALRRAGRGARGATLYINLEPCAHFGRTPPCTTALIRAGVRRVVAAVPDPNPKVSGRGFRQLRRAGIAVSVGLAGKEARALNEVYFKWIRTGRPFVICKAGMSLDGKIACSSGASRWITGPEARKFAHGLRAAAGAVIVGAGTLSHDDPLLTPRGVKARTPGRPWRVILEGRRPLPPGSRIFRAAPQDGRVIVATAGRRRGPRARLRNARLWHLPGANGRVDVQALLARLAAEGVHFVLVEGGGEVHASFLGLDAGARVVLADRIYFILAPRLLGGKNAPGPVGGRGVSDPKNALRLRNLRWQSLGRDYLVMAEPIRSAPGGR